MSERDSVASKYAQESRRSDGTLTSPVQGHNHGSALKRKFRRKADPQTQLLSMIMREIKGEREVSRNHLVSRDQKLTTERIDDALTALVDLGVVKRTKNGERYRHSLRPIEEGGPKDFLILRARKKVRVSPEGHRAVRVESKVMALRDNVTTRPCGSLIWSDKVSAPKYRLGPAHRMDPSSNKNESDPTFEIVKKQSNDMAFKLNFEPALSPGEVVDYGFYIWTQNYYCKTRKESLAKYHDEWTREGMSVNDPSFYLEISVKLPEGYHYQQARFEKNPVLTRDGPNVPGSIISAFPANEKVLRIEMKTPTSGHYFVSWIPPE